jgi:hypothetical protein
LGSANEQTRAFKKKKVEVIEDRINKIHDTITGGIAVRLNALEEG